MKPNADRQASLDRILLGEEEMIPSSGFLAATMERVRDQAAMPAPIPFPWKRAIPGILLVSGTLGWGAWEAFHYALLAAQNLPLTVPTLPAVSVRPLEEAGWVALALGVSFVSWILSAGLVRRSRML